MATKAASSRQNGRGDSTNAPARARTNNATGNGSNGHHEPRSGERNAVEAVVRDIVGGPAKRWLPGTGVVKLAARLATRPQAVARRGVGFAAELARIAAGRSEQEPEEGDRRFKDAAWESNPAFKRLLQAYLAAGDTVDGLISDADLDWRAERRVRFAAENILDAIAPTNFPVTNPAVIKATIDSGGAHFLAGARNLAGDLRERPLLPSSVDTSQFEVGENLAVTPGDVVLRTEVFELIQYRPSTERVYEQPLLVVPAMINKYYIADLAPGKSLIEYAVGQGHQVFMMSWVDPDERHADWNMDTYAQAVLDALDAVEEIIDAPKVQLLGMCAGGQIASTVASHLATIGEEDRLGGLTLLVAALDMRRMGTVGSFMEESTSVLGMLDSARRGYVDGRSLAGVFSWMRPNDMVWSYVVNNYLLGKSPPAFDVLYWNNDQVNLAAGLHRDFVQMGLDNALAKPGEMTVLGTPVDLSKISLDNYLVAGVDDHLVAWKNAYSSTQLIGGDSRFVLSTSGHIVAFVNPPGKDKASFRTGDESVRDPDEWLRGAGTQEGTWWTDWTEWLGERSGEQRDAPASAGSDEYPPLVPAPGTYVRA